MTRNNKRTPLSILGLILLLASSASLGAESLRALAKRINLAQMEAGIRNGDRNVFAALPAKGYRNGISDILNRYDVYVHPKYSFTGCGEDMKFTDKVGVGAPGCVVSLKVARKMANGSLQDMGIRIEYAIAPGGHQFEPNNSAYARNAVSGNGLLEGQLDH